MPRRSIFVILITKILFSSIKPLVLESSHHRTIAPPHHRTPKVSLALSAPHHLGTGLGQGGGVNQNLTFRLFCMYICPFTG